MQDYLDIRILSFVAAIVSLVLFAGMTFVFYSRKTYQGFGLWAYGSLFGFLSMGLMSLRGYVPDLFSIVIANTCIAVALGLITIGLESFTGIKQRIRQHALIIGVQVATFFYYTYLLPSINARIVIISFVIAYFSLYSCFYSYQNIPRSVNSSNWLLTASFAIFGGWFALRIPYTLYTDVTLINFMQYPAAHSISLIIFFSCQILIYLGLIVLNSQRVELELSNTMADIKVLKGIIPICSHCKKIRDKEGGWKQLESYISAHSEADFSHGACEVCIKEHYPDLDLDKRRL